MLLTHDSLVGGVFCVQNSGAQPSNAMEALGATVGRTSEIDVDIAGIRNLRLRAELAPPGSPGFLDSGPPGGCAGSRRYHGFQILSKSYKSAIPLINFATKP